MTQILISLIFAPIFTCWHTATRNIRRQFTDLQNHFLDAYSSETGWQWDEKFLFFYIYSCLKIAKQLCKFRGPRPWPEGDEQQAQVWLMIEQGLTILEGAKTSSAQKETGSACL